MFTKKLRPAGNSSNDTTLWKWFSQYVRLRDRISCTDNCACISCGAVGHWKSFDAGHFVPRDRWTTRYHEKNVNAQCQKCNRFSDGNQYQHGRGIDNKYGEGTADYLQSIGKRTNKLSRDAIKALSNIYREKTKELMK